MQKCINSRTLGVQSEFHAETSRYLTRRTSRPPLYTMSWLLEPAKIFNSSILAAESHIFLHDFILEKVAAGGAEVDLEVAFLTSPPSLTWHVPVTGLRMKLGSGRGGFYG